MIKIASTLNSAGELIYSHTLIQGQIGTALVYVDVYEGNSDTKILDNGTMSVKNSNVGQYNYIWAYGTYRGNFNAVYKATDGGTRYMKTEQILITTKSVDAL